MHRENKVRVSLAAVGLLFWLLSGTGQAEVSLSAIFSNHMVLQAGSDAPIWGWAAPGEAVSVEFAGQSKTVKAGRDGKWKVKLDKLAPKTAGALTVKGRNTLLVEDVLVGEVWLCSGQSNMAAAYPACKDAASLSQIRTFREMSGSAVDPQEKAKGEWVVCSPKTLGSFSAVGFYFGQELHEKTGQPMGLINASVPATMIEGWTSLKAQQGEAELQPLLAEWDRRVAAYNPEKAKADFQKAQEIYAAVAEKAKADGIPAPRPPSLPRSPREGAYPGNLFNGKMAPLIPYAIRGAIWYQGESNANGPARGKLYAKQLEVLIKDWRTQWGQGDFPFAWVQLPNYGDASRSSGWAEARESMLKSLAIPNTGMAIAIDLGEAKNLHPPNKKDIGYRLALWALARVYGQTMPFSGPLPAGFEIKGGEVVCSFKHTEGGLRAKEGELRGFAIAGADTQWVKADAKVRGGRVVVSSPDIQSPVAVRYAWADCPDCNLVNGAGLPASPFRTDDWE